MPKRTYRIRNWGQYNKALELRGSITVWIDEKIAKKWYSKTRVCKKGHPIVYSDFAVLSTLIFKELFRLPFRQCRGFMMSLMRLMNLNLKVLSYTQLCRRRKSAKLPKLTNRRGKPINIVLDTSGLKVYGEGEWKVKKHGWCKHRTWRKWHIAVNLDGLEVISEDLTTHESCDAKHLPKLVKEYGGSIANIYGDGAYDSHDNFIFIERYGGTSFIPTQRNPKHKRKELSSLRNDFPRDNVAYEQQQLGHDNWKKSSGYHQRSLVENAFHRLKKIFGERLSARCLENQAVESKLRCIILNRMTMLGMPETVSVTV